MQNSFRNSYIGSRTFRDSEFINKAEIIKDFLNNKPSVSIFKDSSKNEDVSKKHLSVSFFQNFRKSSCFSGKELLNLNLEQHKELIKLSDIEKYDEAQILELAINILKKPMKNRGNYDIKLLKKCTENISFFEDVAKDKGQDIIENLCISMGHKYLKEGDCVFKEGSLGTTFFIILKGSVSVLKKEMIKFDDPNEISSELPKTLKKALTLTQEKSFKRKKHNNNNNNFDYEINEVEVKILERGASFGELALLENKPRAATVICKENCHFAILEKQYFDQILKENELRRFYKKIDFLANLKLLNTWTFSSIRGLYLNSEEKTFLRNQIIYHEEDVSDCFYLVKSGEFKMFKNISILSDNQLIKKKIIEEKIPKLNTSHISRGSNKILEVAILTTGEHFGEEELLQHTNRKFNVICEKQGILVVVKKKEFNRKICADFKTKEYLLEQIDLKQEWRNQKIKDFLFANSSGNTFLQDLLPYKDVMKFDMNAVHGIINGENKGDSELKLKEKLSKFMERNINYDKAFGCITDFMFFLSKRNQYKMGNSKLFDYFLKSNKNGLDLKYLLKSKILKKNHDDVSRHYLHESTTTTSSFRELLKQKSLFEKYEISHFNPNIKEISNFNQKTVNQHDQNISTVPEKKRSISMHNLNLSKAIQSNDSFLPMTERKTLSSFRNRKNIGNYSEEPKNKPYKLNTDHLPLKYNSEKIFMAKRKKTGKKSISLHITSK